MGFFDGLFKNPLGTIANTVAAPFKAGGNILSGKGNIGDLFSLGSLFMPGGNFTGDIAKWGTGNFGLSSLLGSQGLGDISKWQTKDFASLLPMLMQGGGQQGGQGGGMNFSGDLAGMAGNLSQMELLAMLQRYPQMLQAKDRAYNSLSQSGTRATANSLGNQAQARGAEAGRANANALQRQGYASSVSDAAKLQGRNQGTQQANSLLAAIMGPQGQAQNAMAQSQVYSPGGLSGGGLQSLFGIQNQASNQRQADASYNASKPPSFLETLLGIAPTLASVYMDNKAPRQQMSIMPGDNPFRPVPKLNVTPFDKAVQGISGGQGIAQPKSWFDTGGKK